MEVIISDGMSTDKTRAEIAAWMDENPDLVIRVVDNIKQSIPSGVNRAIEAAQGEFIVRLDAHSMPNKDYIERSITILKGGWGIMLVGFGELFLVEIVRLHARSQARLLILWA